MKLTAACRNADKIAITKSEQKKDLYVLARLIGLFILMVTLCVLLLPQEAYAHPAKEASCTACHTLNDPDASFSVFIDNAATTSIEVPNDGTASFEIDYFFSNATDSATYEGVGVELAVPSGWGVAAGTNAFSPPGWNAAWDLADGVGWSPVFDTSEQFPNEPDGYTVNFNTSPWDIGNRDAACDNGGSCSSGTDQDGTIDTMGTDAIVSIPLGTPGGSYTVRVMGVGHHTAVKSYVSDLITVTVTADVTSAVGEISPNSTVVNSLGNVFTYDILPTITGLATGVNRVEITAPSAYANLNVTGASVGGSGLTANCPTPGAGQYCATIAAPIMTIDLGTKVTTSLTNIQVTFTADAPVSTGDDTFTSTVDDTGTARPAVTTNVGNADGNPGDNNSQTVTVVGNSLTWVGGNDTDFNNSLNWSPNRIPTLSDECTINSYSTFQPVILSNAQCGSITLGTGGTVISLTFSGNNNLDISGDMVIGANGRLSPSGTPSGSFTVTGNWSDDIGTTNFTSPNLHLEYIFEGLAEAVFTDESFYDVHIHGDIALSSDLIIANSLDITNGATLIQGANTIIMNGTSFLINGAYTHDCNSVLEINSTFSLQSNKRYPEVIVNSGADVSGANPAYIDCDLTLQSGATFDPGSNLYLKGDWINNGATVDVNLTTVYFTGLNPQIGGTTQTDFYNLVIGDAPGTVINPTYNLSIANNLTVSAGAELNITAGNDISVVKNTSISGDLNLSGTTTWNQGGGNNVGITVDFGGLLSAQGTDSGNRVTFTRSDSNYYQMIVNGGIDFQYVNLFYTQDAAAGAGIAIKSLPGEIVNFDYVAINYAADANGATMMYWDSNRTLNTTGVTFDSSTYIANDDNVEAVQGTINFSNYGGNFAGEALDNDNGGFANWIAATTTIGDGTAPSNKTVAHNSTNNAVSSFTLSTDTGGDTLSSLTVTFSGTSVSDVASNGAKIYKDDGTNPNEWDASDTQIGSSVTFSGSTATFGSLSEPINTTPTQYLITYDIAGGATSSNTLQGAVTAATVTNTLINNDSNDATLTVDSGPYNVYYSVGQSTVTNLMTGTPTMTIVNGTATFSAPQTAVNMGIGDEITYNGGDIAYISGKTSTSVWSLLTARGSTPANVTDATVDSISHAYASLSAAEAGATDAAHLNTTDLVTGDYVLHFPCYYDTGPDTTAVTVDGYTTGPNNYIGIYTPTDPSTEVNQSQRHDGKWNNGKYYIDVGAGSNLPLILSDEHVRVDGLQITTTFVAGGSSAQAIDLRNIGNNADIRISNNVLNGGNIGTAGDWNRFGIILGSVGSSSAVRIWNNIIYEWGGRGWGIYISDPDVTAYVYNNTIYDNPWFGIRVANGAVIAKNNLVFGSGNANTYSGTFAAGTDYNSTDSTDNIGQGSNNRTSQTFTFVNTGTDDYHLASTDTGALNHGVDLSGDPNLAFSNDIDGATRPIDGIWDIGADETAGSIFTTIGDGTTPSDKTVAHNSINNAVNAFTLSTSSGSDTLTELVVTFSGDSSSDVAPNGVKIYKDNGTNPNEWDSSDTQIGSSVSFIVTTATFGSLSEAINSTPTQYLITYDIAGGATSGNTLQGAATNATVSNALVKNDSNDATLTVDTGPYNVYYSVGQSTVTNLMTGTPTMTIVNGTATFTTPQTTSNMGVGDKVTYNGGDTAYISGKTSTSVWSLLTARGSTPANVTNATVGSIKREFDSLSNAESGATDAAHLNTADLVTGDYVLHFPCYYDSGPDSSADVDGYTTGPNNYIKIYTPNDTATEVNQSQRHDGKYNATKYIMQLATGVILAIKDNYVRVEGLQFRSTSNAASNYHINVTNDIVGVGDVRLSHNYIEGSNNTTGNAKGIYVYSGLSSSFVARIWNNIVYNVGTTGGSTQGVIIWDTDVTVYIYNNTLYRSNRFLSKSTNTIAKNNLVIDDYMTDTFDTVNSTNNAAGQGTPPGTNPISLTTTTVTDYLISGTDLHINPAATNANEIINTGVDLSSDPNLAFSDDVDKNSRPYNLFWDVGADEETSLPTYSISGNVFEDKVINNGAGEPFNGGEGDAGIDGVRVELFRASDSLYLGFTTTAGGGDYSFNSLGGSTNYKVRVVASTVDGSGGSLGEQTFESDGTTDYGTFTTAMGGQAAATADTATLSTLTGAEHWVQVSLAAANVTGVDFGFSYDLIVNSNNTGQGALRQFITNAGDIAGANTSVFNIPNTDGNYQNGGAGASYWRIQPASTYTIAVGDISIDASTQTTNATALGYFVNANGPEIEIFGNGLASNGITVNNVGSVTIKELVINSFTGNGVDISGAAATGIYLYGNYIGTNAFGDTDLGNGGTGVYVASSASGNFIGGPNAGEGNVISGNNTHGIHILTDNNEILGNKIGTDRTGTAIIPNNSTGIQINGPANNTIVGGQIGGAPVCTGNIISGNGSYGINIGGTAANIDICGNTIGSGVAGTEDLGNIDVGINIGTAAAATNIRIGGLKAGEGNLIAYNGGQGIGTFTSGTGDEIKANTIHDNDLEGIFSGIADLVIEKNIVYNHSAGTRDGIRLAAGSANNKVYHNTVHSNAGDGISVAAAGAIIKNNIITGNGTGGSGYGINVNGGAMTDAYNLITDAATSPVNISGQSNVALDGTTVNADPLYNDEPGDDYTLTECTSPAINMACDLGAADLDDTFCDSAADGAQPDMNGVAIGNFNNNAPDMGAFETGNCVPGLTIVKQVWEEDGSAPLGNPTAPVGATLVFLIYVKNTTAGTVSDLRINDDLDEAGFEYIAGSLVRTVAGSPPSDTATDKQIFDATASGIGTDLFDPVDGDVASAQDTADLGTDVDKITIGAVFGQANASLSIDAHKTFALRFEVKVK